MFFAQKKDPYRIRKESQWFFISLTSVLSSPILQALGATLRSQLRPGDDLKARVMSRVFFLLDPQDTSCYAGTTNGH